MTRKMRTMESSLCNELYTDKYKIINFKRKRIMNIKNEQMQPLSTNEQGLLQGGFVASKKAETGVEMHFFSDNGNCKGGGWCDDNTNCNNACAGCNKVGALQPSPKANDLMEG